MVGCVRHLAIVAIAMTAFRPGPAAAETPLAVEVVTVEAASVPRVFSGTGEVVARDLRSLSFAGGGRVVSVFVDAGDTVRQGQEMARQEWHARLAARTKGRLKPRPRRICLPASRLASSGA